MRPSWSHPLYPVCFYRWYTLKGPAYFPYHPRFGRMDFGRHDKCLSLNEYHKFTGYQPALRLLWRWSKAPLNPMIQHFYFTGLVKMSNKTEKKVENSKNTYKYSGTTQKWACNYIMLSAHWNIISNVSPRPPRPLAPPTPPSPAPPSAKTTIPRYTPPHMTSVGVYDFLWGSLFGKKRHPSTISQQANGGHFCGHFCVILMISKDVDSSTHI